MKDSIIREVYQKLENRRDNPTGSYTSNLMQDDDKLAEDKILEKIGEETTELILAAKNNEYLIQEAADLIFHTLLLLVYKKMDLDKLFNEFEIRKS